MPFANDCRTVCVLPIGTIPTWPTYFFTLCRQSCIVFVLFLAHNFEVHGLPCTASKQGTLNLLLRHKPSIIWETTLQDWPGSKATNHPCTVFFWITARKNPKRTGKFGTCEGTTVICSRVKGTHSHMNRM